MAREQRNSHLLYLDAPRDGVTPAAAIINQHYAYAAANGLTLVQTPGNYAIHEPLIAVDGLEMDTSARGVVFHRKYSEAGNKGLIQNADFTVPVTAKIGGFTIACPDASTYQGNSICLNLAQGSALENIHGREWYGVGATKSRLAVLAANDALVRNITGKTVGTGGGIRGVAGKNVLIHGCNVYCGDDVYQMVPIGTTGALLFGEDMINWVFADSIGYSGLARLCVAILTGQVGGGSLHMTSSIKHGAFRNIRGRADGSDANTGPRAFFIQNDESTGVIQDIEIDGVYCDCTADTASASAGLISAATGTGGIDFVKVKGGGIEGPCKTSVKTTGTGLLSRIYFEGFDFGKPRTSGEITVDWQDVDGGAIERCRAKGNGADIISLGAGGTTTRKTVIRNNVLADIDNGKFGIVSQYAVGAHIENNTFKERSGQTTARAINQTTNSSELTLGPNDYVGITAAEKITYASPIAGLNKMAAMDNATRNVTVSATLRVHECGLTETNSSATALVTRTLPPAKPSMRYSWAVLDADGFKIQADGTDTIRMGTSVTAAGGYIQSTEVGATVTLVCSLLGVWVAEYRGTWSVN
jgi:hypothetical protein